MYKGYAAYEDKTSRQIPPDPAGAADPGQAELNRLKPWRPLPW
jgi:hypothetical protein